MKNDVYTLEDMKELNIITDHYQKITAPEIVTARLEMKAQCKDKYTLRVFFSFMDGRKIITPVFWWQGYVEIPIGSFLCLTYIPGKKGQFILKSAEPL